MNSPIADRVADQVRTLPPELQRRVLDFARALAISEPRGIPGRQLLQFSAKLSSEDAQQMRDAIEQGCEKIDSNDW